MKKEFDEETKHVKGVLNESYNQFLTPILTEISNMLMKTMKAEK
jgi:hypothetical protein